MNTEVNSRLIGSAGEYFVAGELSRHGVVAALTMAGTDAFDILAINGQGQQFAVQVKTTKDKKSTWLLSKKDEQTVAQYLYYVFVRLNGEELPDCYVVPSAVVVREIRERHRRWMEAPARNGNHHRDSGIREFQIEERDPRYYRRWDYFINGD